MSLLTVKEVAAILRVDYDTALGFIHSDKLQGIRLGGRRTIQVDAADLDAFIEDSKLGPPVGRKAQRKPRKMAPNHGGPKSAKVLPFQWMEKYGGR